MQVRISIDDCEGSFSMIEVVSPLHTVSGSLTVIDVASTNSTTLNGSIVLGPMKSPGTTKGLGSAEVVRTALPVIEVAVIDNVVGIAPTHDAIRLTRALAD
jgi:hypothetical protein